MRCCPGKSIFIGLIVALAAFSYFTRNLPPESREASEQDPLPVSTAAAAENKDSEWGTIKGQIVYGGDTLPEIKPIDVPVDKNRDHCLSNGPILPEEWVINKDNKGVRWVFVWLEPMNKGDKIPVHPDLEKIPQTAVVMDQPRCRFEPHAVAIREGQVLNVKNSSPIPHNVHWTGFAKNPGDNKSVSSKSSLEIKDLKADAYGVKVQCDIHGWMHAWVRIYSHPYFAVTDADGKFEIPNAPAGNFRLKIWHDTGYLGGAKGRQGRPIEIKNGVNDLGKIEFKPN